MQPLNEVALLTGLPLLHRALVPALHRAVFVGWLFLDLCARHHGEHPISDLAPSPVLPCSLQAV